MVDKYYRIIVDSKGAEKDVKEFDSSMRQAGKTGDQLNTKMKPLSAAIKGVFAGAALAAAAKTVSVLIGVQREFDKLNASLITVTGSTEKAAMAFDAVQRLAAQTPYDVNQVAEAFIRLKNLGLDPSEKAIISYGNTAAAMGKDLNQMIEAVADAATGEFERLKEFGIRSKNQGDTIAFTFQGLTTTVKNNAAEIEGYLQSLGENQFAGAMAQRMDTLDGKISNLGDAWDSLQRTMAGGAFADAAKAAVEAISDAINWLTDMINSGQLSAGLDGLLANFSGFANDISGAFNWIGKEFDGLSSTFENEFALIGDIVTNAGKLVSEAFTNAIPNIRAFIQLMTVEVAATIDKVAARTEYLYTALSEFSFEEAAVKLDAQMKIIDAARLDSIDSILKEADATIVARDKQISKAQELRAEYELLREMQIEADSLGAGTLGQFKLEKPAAVAETAKPEKIKNKDISGPLQNIEETIQAYKDETALIQNELDYRAQIQAQYGETIYGSKASQYEKEKALLNIQMSDRIFSEQQASQATMANLAADQEANLNQLNALIANKQAYIEQETNLSAAQREQVLADVALLEQGKNDIKAVYDEQKIAQEALTQERISEITREHAEAREKLEQQELANKISNFSSYASQALGLFSSFGAQSFGKSQKLAKAQALAALPSAVLQSFQNGGGYPMGLIPAGLMLATGVKQIADIGKAGAGLGVSGGGGAMPSMSLGSGGGAMPMSIPSNAKTETEKVAQRKSIEIKLQPGLYTHEQVRELAMKMAEDDESVNIISSAQSDAMRRGAYA
jgi:hypothetical protein